MLCQRTGLGSQLAYAVAFLGTHPGVRLVSLMIGANTIELNRAMDTAARPFHVVIANGFAEFRTASLRFGHQPCLAGLITQLNGQAGSCGIHPSYAGQTLLAHALEKVIRF